MSIKSTIQRILFYGLVFYLGYRCAMYFSPEIKAIDYSKIVLVFAIASAVIQSLSYAIFTKISGAYNINNITRWSKNILDNNFSERRELLKHRFFFGISVSFAIGALSAYGYLNKDDLVSTSLIALTATLVLGVIISMFISFKEYFDLEKLIHDLSEKSRRIEQKQKFLNG